MVFGALAGNGSYGGGGRDGEPQSVAAARWRNVQIDTFMRVSREDSRHGHGIGVHGVKAAGVGTSALDIAVKALDPVKVEYFSPATEQREMARLFPGRRHVLFRALDPRRYSMWFNRYKDAAGRCEVCARGRYADAGAQAACKICASGLYQDVEGQTSCKPRACAGDTYFDDDDARRNETVPCTPCPDAGGVKGCAEAAFAAADWPTLVLSAGTYDMTVRDTNPLTIPASKRLTIVGAGKHATVIDGQFDAQIWVVS
eukprot:g7442.t1